MIAFKFTGVALRRQAQQIGTARDLLPQLEWEQIRGGCGQGPAALRSQVLHGLYARVGVVQRGASAVVRDVEPRAIEHEELSAPAFGLRHSTT